MPLAQRKLDLHYYARSKIIGYNRKFGRNIPWVRFWYHVLRMLVNNALRISRSLVVSSSEITEMIKAIVDAPDTDDSELQDLFSKKKGKDMYHSKVRIFINKTIHV